MHSRQILDFHRKRPFQPISILLDDGRVLEVRDPSHLLVSPILVFIGTDIDASGLPGDSVMTDPCHVVRIDSLPSNGSAGCREVPCAP